MNTNEHEKIELGATLILTERRSSDRRKRGALQRFHDAGLKTGVPILRIVDRG
jgi:hypothetical protein